MNLNQFLHNLHFDVDKVRPPDWDVDWEEAPLPYKLYRGLPVFPLSADVPLSLAPDVAAAPGAAEPSDGLPVGEPDLDTIGHFLWYVYGLNQLSHSALALGEAGLDSGSMYTPRRFVPSGGALYPSELYAYLKIRDLPRGVYHYDAAHHRLVLLREGDFDSYLERALGGGCRVSACFGTLMVSTMFWKNFYKYADFAARLQGLDAGVMIGQALAVAKRFGFGSAVHYQFLDRAVNHLLGLSEREETVFAVVPLSMQPVSEWFGTGADGPAGVTNGRETVTASALCNELPRLEHHHFVRSRTVKDCPALVELNQAAMLESTGWERMAEVGEPVVASGSTVSLPAVSPLEYDLATACQTRYSPGTDFVLGRVDAARLASLLHETIAAFHYANDLDGVSGRPSSRLSLCACLYGIDGIPDGAYSYEAADHALRLIGSGDHRLWLQQGMTMHNVNLFQVPICLHVAGDLHHLPSLGMRGYRIQQLEAGILVQRLLLAACALGMGGHPLLGFDATLCDELYNLAEQAKTSLIQVPVGPHQPHPRLQGGLHG
jgi:SagB-type dehydrogenase family enzyme